MLDKVDLIFADLRESLLKCRKLSHVEASRCQRFWDVSQLQLDLSHTYFIQIRRLESHSKDMILKCEKFNMIILIRRNSLFRLLNISWSRRSMNSLTVIKRCLIACLKSVLKTNKTSNILLIKKYSSHVLSICYQYSQKYVFIFVQFRNFVSLSYLIGQVSLTEWIYNMSIYI